MGTTTSSHVTAIPAAGPEEAAEHFERLLALETDCWDVHESMKDGAPDFVLLHVNGDRAGFDAGHVPGATFMHHSTINESTLAPYPAATLFVVYCAGLALQRRRPGRCPPGVARVADPEDDRRQDRVAGRRLRTDHILTDPEGRGLYSRQPAARSTPEPRGASTTEAAVERARCRDHLAAHLQLGRARCVSAGTTTRWMPRSSPASTCTSSGRSTSRARPTRCTATPMSSSACCCRGACC